LTSSACPGRGYRVTNARPITASLGGAGSDSRVLPRYRPAKATKRGGKGGGSRTPSSYRRSRGSWTAGTLRREGGCSLWNRGGDTRPRPVLGFRVPGTVTGSAAAGEARTGGTGCVNWARPDLWELWVGNHPERPGTLFLFMTDKVRCPLFRPLFRPEWPRRSRARQLHACKDSPVHCRRIRNPSCRI
jgi:hypothetical protein